MAIALAPQRTLLRVMIAIEMSLRTRSWKTAPIAVGAPTRIVAAISAPAIREDCVGAISRTPASARIVVGTASSTRSDSECSQPVLLPGGFARGAADRDLSEAEFTEVGRDLGDREDRRPLSEAAAPERSHDDRRHHDPEGEIADAPDHLDADVKGRSARSDPDGRPALRGDLLSRLAHGP